MPGVQRAARTGSRQQVKLRRAAAAQPRKQVGRCDAAHARGCQFDGQGHTFQRPDQLNQRRAIARAEVKIGPYRARAVDEQRNGGVAGGAGHIGVDGGQLEHSHRQLMLAVDAKSAPRRDQQMQRWQQPDQLLNQILRNADQLLKVVQQQQCAAPGQCVDQGAHRLGGRWRDLQHAGQRVAGLRARGAGRQRDKRDQIEGLESVCCGQRPAGIVAQRMRHLNRQARFAGAARADQGHQAVRQHQATQARALLIGTEQACQVGGQADPRNRRCSLGPGR